MPSIQLQAIVESISCAKAALSLAVCVTLPAAGNFDEFARKTIISRCDSKHRDYHERSRKLAKFQTLAGLRHLAVNLR
jgi:hypothetical protein